MSDKILKALRYITTHSDPHLRVVDSYGGDLQVGIHQLASDTVDALEQEQSRADANADHAKLANQNQATQAKALKTANERIEQLEDGIRKSPCEVMILQDQPWKDCFPVEPCEPCHCVRSLLVEDTGL